MNLKLKLISVVSILLLSYQGNAQNARVESVKIKKVSQSGFVADYTVSKSLMQLTLDDKISKAVNTKGSKSSGFRLYKGVTFPALSANKVDIYTKVEGKKNAPKVLMLVSTGYDNFVTTSSDATTSNNIITFLNGLSQDANAKQAELDLLAQQKKVKEAEAKLKKSQKEQERIAKEKERLEKKLVEEKNAGEAAESKAQKEQEKLQNLKNSNTTEN